MLSDPNATRKLIESTNGQFFTVKFVKRSDNSVRVMNCRTGVKQGLVGGVLPYNAKEAKLIPVYEMKTENRRCIPLENIISISYKKTVTTF